VRGFIFLGLLLSVGACHPGARVRHGPAWGGIHLNTDENVHEKRREWFQGLYRDCVDKDYANACFKTGQNLEDGVAVPQNAEDAHWFYAKACVLQPSDLYCQAAERTDPDLAAKREHYDHGDADHHREPTD
jgi:TPR repeat protein